MKLTSMLKRVHALVHGQVTYAMSFCKVFVILFKIVIISSIFLIVLSTPIVKAEESKVWTDKTVYHIGETINIHVNLTAPMAYWLIVHSPDGSESKYDLPLWINVSYGQVVATLEAKHPIGRYKVELWGATFDPGASPVLCAYYYFEIREASSGTYAITFLTEPPDVGSIIFAGTTYLSGQGGIYVAGIYQVEANAPRGYVFYEWITHGGVTVASSESRQTAASVTGSGSLIAVFKWLVKIRGTVVRHIQEQYGTWPAIEVKVEELLLDSSNRLKVGEVAIVYRETPFADINDGDRVEVYGLGFWMYSPGEEEHGIVIKWPEHYVRKIATVAREFRILVTFTRFPDEGDHFEKKLTTNLRDFLQKLEYVSKYFHVQSFSTDSVTFIIDFPGILMPKQAGEYPDGIPGDGYYTPSAKYLNDVWDNLAARYNMHEYQGILVVQTDWASAIHNLNGFRAATYNPSLLPPGVEKFFGMYKGDVPAAMITFDADAEVIAHELGHVLYKFKDYYMEEGSLSLVVSGGDVKYWCIMGGPLDEEGPEIDQPIFSLNKVEAGWLKGKEIEIDDAKSHTFEIKSLEGMTFGDEVLILYRRSGSWIHPYTILYLLEGRETFPWDYVSPGFIEKKFGIDKGIVIYRRGISPLIVGGWIKVDPSFGEKGWSWTLPTLSEKSPIYADASTSILFVYKGYNEKTGKFIIEVKINPKYFADINKDNIVDYKDLAILTSSYGKSAKENDFNPSVDINGDGLVDYKDLAILIANYGGRSS